MTSQNSEGFAFKINPDDAKPCYSLGLVYYKEGKLDESIKAYSQALKIKPDYVEAHYNLGLVYKMKDLKNEARMEFEMILELSLNNPKAYQAIMELK